MKQEIMIKDYVNSFIETHNDKTIYVEIYYIKFDGAERQIEAFGNDPKLTKWLNIYGRNREIEKLIITHNVFDDEYIITIYH